MNETLTKAGMGDINERMVSMNETPTKAGMGDINE